MKSVSPAVRQGESLAFPAKGEEEEPIDQKRERLDLPS